MISGGSRMSSSGGSVCLGIWRYVYNMHSVVGSSAKGNIGRGYRSCKLV